MLFNSIEFLIFLPIVLMVYYTIPDRIKYLWLLAASYFFYMCWNAKYALLMLFSTTITYLCSLAMEWVKNKTWEEKKQVFCKKIVLFLSFALNLLVLAYYKYFNFAIELLTDLLAFVHVTLTVPQFDIILPVGISFYTFQALSYTMDVYRDEIQAEKNFFRYALFVSFFPQLVAGPIERSKNLLMQLAKPVPFCGERVVKGIFIMLWGFFLKAVLADRVAIFVDTVYGDFASYGGGILVVATVLFAFQIYCDFYGYSTIAKGSALLLGIHLMENFQAPYLSASVSEFWRNWHISLTSWFKDYLYIPLGGSRKGTMRKYLNKLIVFLVSGLWHGANLTFVVWGALNGIYQVIGEATRPYKDKVLQAIRLRDTNFVYRLMQMLITFVLVDFSWIFFRAATLSDAAQIIRQMLFMPNMSQLMDGTVFACGLSARGFIAVAVSVVILLLADIFKKRNISIVDKLMRCPWWLRSVLLSVAICLIIIFGIWGPEYDQANFIYFQF